MPFVLGAIFFLTRYFAGHSRDEAFILYGFAGTAGALFEARTLIFWILSLVTIFVYNLVNKHFARGFYQVLCIIFGNTNHATNNRRGNNNYIIDYCF